MSLLVPDYSSSSEDEAPPRVAKPIPQAPAPVLLCPNEPSAASERAVEPTKSTKKKVTKKKAKKAKTALFLPPEIQKLLESGTLGDSDDDDDDDSLLAKQKRAVAKRPRSADATKEAEAKSSTSLSFLPAPKHQIDEPKAKLPSTVVEAPPTTTEQQPVGQEGPTDPYASQQQQYDQQQYDQQQYYYQQYYQQQQQEYIPQEDPDQQPTSKRARHRDRELERMLQRGQFDAVADKIVEIAAPAPDAWQAPPVEQLKKGSASELKVTASFWNASAGAAVASVKPSRLQRQKHQLNQLAFDAKAREHELLDRKGAAIKTKRETHAKYGW